MQLDFHLRFLLHKEFLRTFSLQVPEPALTLLLAQQRSLALSLHCSWRGSSFHFDLRGTSGRVRTLRFRLDIIIIFIWSFMIFKGLFWTFEKVMSNEMNIETSNSSEARTANVSGNKLWLFSCNISGICWTRCSSRENKWCTSGK